MIRLIESIETKHNDFFFETVSYPVTPAGVELACLDQSDLELAGILLSPVSTSPLLGITIAHYRTPSTVLFWCLVFIVVKCKILSRLEYELVVASAGLNLQTDTGEVSVKCDMFLQFEWVSHHWEFLYRKLAQEAPKRYVGDYSYRGVGGKKATNVSRGRSD